MNLYSLLSIQPGFVPDTIINTLLSTKSENYSQALVGYNSTQEVTDHRKTKWLTLPKDIHGHLYRSIYQIYEEHLKCVYKNNLTGIEPPQFLRYDVGDHYDIHNDSESYVNGTLKRVVERDISILLYLNDEYRGGELEFTQLQLAIKPKKGMLIAFPSYAEFEHKVHPIVEGTRYNIVSWVITEKRIYERPI